MNKFTKLFIVVVIIAGILIGIGIYYYFSSEVKIQEESKITYVNLNIITVDNEKQLPINVIISSISPNNHYSNSTTFPNDYLSMKVPINSTYYVRTNNLSYYTTIKKQEVFTSEPRRIILDLTKSSNIEVKSLNTFNNSCNITLSIKTNGIFKDAILCVRWSKNIISLYSDRFNFEKSNKYAKYDKCFNLGDFNNEEKLTNIHCSVFNSLDNLDYLQFVVYDRDIYEGVENKDFGHEYYFNLTYNINNI